jgi:ubiquinone/menaquinone biosynthesis C-methylase UbiE
MTNSIEIQKNTQEQYRESGNLNARIRLHQRFSTNHYGWSRWLVDHLLVLPAQSRILELGCGSGALWSGQIERTPAGWSAVLSDYSPGMAIEAKKNLARNGQFRFAVLDAQRIPYPDDTFDAVIANHMLYHIPDRPRALAEARRVLRPGGWFLAATNGAGHLAELDLLAAQASESATEKQSQLAIMAAFSLDNGAGQLSDWFEQVQVQEYEDRLEVTEVQPLIDYIRSMIRMSKDQPQISHEQERRLAGLIESEIAARGAYHISKRAGLFTAKKAY